MTDRARRTETVDTTTNWKPDPFGVHELRFFSADGKPTLLVMDGGKRSYDQPPKDQAKSPPQGDQLESGPMPPQRLTAAETQPAAPATPPSAFSASQNGGQARRREDTGEPSRSESGLMPDQQVTPAKTQPAAPPAAPPAPPVSDEAGQARGGEPSGDRSQSEASLSPSQQLTPQTQPLAPPAGEPAPPSVPLEASEVQLPTLVPGPPDGATENFGSSLTDSAPPRDMPLGVSAGDVREHQSEPMSRALKVAYGVVCGVLAVSVLGVLYVHLHHSNGAHSVRAEAPTTTTTTKTTTTTTQPASAPSTVSMLSPTPEVAAGDLVTSWSMNNRLGALAVATPAAATTLFSATYTSGQAISRGCSTSFLPIVCTFGPPGGASPTDPIYQIRVSQAPGGWYVSSVRIEN
jgi:hypothetical protein